MRDVIIQTVSFAFLSSFYIALGLRVLLAKNPFIRSQLWVAVISFAPLTAVSLSTLWPRYPAQSWLPAFVAVGGMTIMCGIALWRFSGRVVIGTTGTALRDALRHALRRLSLSYEESAQAFRLPALNNELTVEAMSFDGMFALRLKKFGDRRAIRQLAAELNDFFRTASAQTNRRLGYWLVVVGAMFLLVGSWLTYEQLSLQAKMRVTREAHQNFFKSSEK
jgi:hypothetical protein